MQCLVEAVQIMQLSILSAASERYALFKQVEAPQRQAMAQVTFAPPELAPCFRPARFASLHRFGVTRRGNDWVMQLRAFILERDWCNGDGEQMACPWLLILILFEQIMHTQVVIAVSDSPLNPIVSAKLLLRAFRRAFDGIVREAVRAEHRPHFTSRPAGHVAAPVAF